MYNCETCMKSYSRKDALKRHINVKHGSSSRFKCGDCLKVFTRKENLRRHIKNTHSKRDDDDVASIGDVDPTPHRIINHSVCDECGKTFANEEDLQTHKIVDHVLLTCDICQAKFTSRELLVRHILSHRKRKKNDDDDDDEKKKKKKKKQKRNARRRVDYLPDEGDEAQPRENDESDIAEVIARNWGAVKNHSRVGKKQTFINVRWRGDNTPDFNAAFKPFFQNTDTKFKIQASHGFVLKKK